jgi:myo-inositol-1(or 4)-monophosphatase
MEHLDEARWLDRELEVAERLALEAGEVLLRHRAAGVVRRTKSGGEVVTAADLEADRVIQDGLRRAFPGDAVLSEEAPDGAARLVAQRVWIVDPIDGTNDFVRGGDEHAVSIGLAVDGRAVLGVVYNPVRDELFSGAEGRGAALGGRPARVTDAADVRAARLTVSATEWYDRLDDERHGLDLRPVSSAAYKLARVAAGLDDGTFSLWPRREWDVCAGVALVLAAGGRVGGLAGQAPRFNRRQVLLPGGLVATGEALYGPLMRALRRLGLVPALAAT